MGQEADLHRARFDGLTSGFEPRASTREKEMLGRLNHVAIAVKDAKQAAKIYGTAFNAEISDAVPLPEHGVITVFVTLPNTK
ncbi:VOC family protein, partial [Acinetobacter baumannii]